ASIKPSEVKHNLQGGDKYIGGGFCPPPKSLQFDQAGAPVRMDFPFTPYCDLASMVRPFIVLLGDFFAARIVFKGD
uniref:virulence factor TspB C-terminal domain-related protein n=1 Tax=Vogesella urethralis TaxID=2592656 RepID=UPI001980C261